MTERRDGALEEVLRSRRREIVDGALALLDEVGVESLTMRALGARLGIRAPSLYHHFAGKEQLLTAMADRIVAEAVVHPVVADWEAALHECALALRSVLSERRDAVRVVAGTAAAGPNSAAIAQTWTDVLRATRLPLEDRVRFALALFSFVLGHVVEERGSAASDVVDTAEHTGGPLWRAYRSVVAEGADRRFEFGFEVLVAAIRSRAATSLVLDTDSGR